METSDIIVKIISTNKKIANYKALLLTTKAMYEQLQGKIFEMSMEISSGCYDISSGTHDYEDVSNEYIKKSILDGLKKRALALIEDEVILEFMIDEHQEKLGEMKQQLGSMEKELKDEWQCWV